MGISELSARALSADAVVHARAVMLLVCPQCRALPGTSCSFGLRRQSPNLTRSHIRRVMRYLVAYERAGEQLEVSAARAPSETSRGLTPAHLAPGEEWLIAHVRS